MNDRSPSLTEPSGSALPNVSPDLPMDVGGSSRNFWAIAWFQITLRVGWIFKTESVIIPAALDSLGAAGWLRGSLPVLARFGQSIPPLLVWPLMKSARRQKRWLVGTSVLMSAMIAATALIWTGLQNSENRSTAQLLFMVLYAVFFAGVGLNQLALSTLIGRLLPVRRRGALMLVANTRGSVLSIVCAAVLLQFWLNGSVARFELIFGTAAACFLLATVFAQLIREPERVQTSEPDDVLPSPPERIPADSRPRVVELVRGVWQTGNESRPFRSVLAISALYGLTMTLFPHYQNLALKRMGCSYDNLLWWLIAQNLGLALFSIPAGKIADRFGNRLVLRIILFLLTLAPLLAILLVRLGPSCSWGFIAIYFLLGLTPITMRVLSNVSLEYCQPHDHSRFLSAQSLSLAMPVLITSSFVGLALDRLGHETVFIAGTVCMTLAWLLALGMAEPRD
jgi:MFS family permease